MNRVAPRIKKSSRENPEVFRTPEHLSDLAYKNFNELAHRARLTPGTAVYANRMIREEVLTKQELIELRNIMTDETADTTEISREILGSEQTLQWIRDCLEGRIPAVN